MVERFDATSQSWHPVRFPVQDVSDIAVLTEYFADVRYELDRTRLDEVKAQVEAAGADALTACSIGESALMYWVEYLAGVENAHYLLIEHEPEVLALFETIHRGLLRRAELLLEYAPCDVLYMVENTSTTLISPQQYRRYCFGHIRAYAQMARDAGRRLVLHMCGRLKALLPDLAAVSATAFEAFTSPPIGDTTLRDGRTGCPDVCLIGGTNAVLWTRPAAAIIAELEAHLAELPHHRGLAVTSAGVMPPMATPETIKAVCDWVHAYPARM